MPAIGIDLGTLTLVSVYFKMEKWNNYERPGKSHHPFLRTLRKKSVLIGEPPKIKVLLIQHYF